MLQSNRNPSIFMATVLLGLVIADSSAIAQKVSTWKTAAGHQFNGYVIENVVGAIGIFRPVGRSIRIVQVIYHPTKYDKVTIEYIEPGWQKYDDFVEKKSQHDSLQYLFGELVKLTGFVNQNKNVSLKELNEIMRSSKLTRRMPGAEKRFCWGYMKLIKFRTDDGTVNYYPLALFQNTPHFEQLSADFETKFKKVIEEQEDRFAEELDAGLFLKRRVIEELPISAFGPTWMGLDPFTPRTQQLMQAAKRAEIILRTAERRQIYLLILKNSM